MNENENKVCPVSCKIEHHAMMFAFLAKHAIELCGEAGKDAILAGMTTYGNERGARMAANALAHGDELTTMTNQAYGEWKPDYAGQMDFGTLRTEPTLQTYIAKCAWCEAWKKHNITEYGKYYCVNVDNAVYQGFRSDFVCTPTATSLSWGGDHCEFDWGHPLSQEEVKELAEKKFRHNNICITCILVLFALASILLTVKLFQFGNAQGKDYLSVLSVILNIVLFAVPISFQIVVGKPLDAHNFISKWLQKMLSKKYKKYGYDKDEEERLQNEYNEVMGTLDELKERISERIPIGV